MTQRFERIRMTGDEFAAALKRIDIGRDTFCRLFGCDTRRVARWAIGEIEIPAWVPPVLRAIEHAPGAIVEIRRDAAERIELDRENPKLGMFPFLEYDGRNDV